MTGFVSSQALNNQPKIQRISPTYFDNVTAAQEWLDNNVLPIVFIANSQGIIDFNNAKPDPRYDCDDYATDLENLALSQGWIITQVPVTNGEIWGVKVTDQDLWWHVGNWTKIDGAYYYIESSPSENRWKLVKIREAD